MEMREISVSGIKLTECENSLCLGTDALLLSSYIRPASKEKALELGAGSGVISLLALKRKLFFSVYAVEIQPELARLCQENAESNGFSDTLTTVCGDIRTLSPDSFIGTSVIFSNPPYMKNGDGKVSPSDARQASRHEVYGGIYDFCDFAGKVLKTGGRFYTVYRPDRLQSLLTALKTSGFAPKRMTFVCSDESHSPSSVLCESVKDGKESLYITPNLYLKKNGNDSPEIKEIWETGAFPKHFFKNKGEK